MCAGLPRRLTPQVPTVDQRRQDVIIGQTGDLLDHGQPDDPAQPCVARHLRPKHKECIDARGQRAVVHDIKPAGGLISAQVPSGQRARVQIVKPDRQGVFTGIIRIMADLEVAHGAVSIIEDGGFRIFCHERDVGRFLGVGRESRVL